jgi:hypothetical protein
MSRCCLGPDRHRRGVLSDLPTRIELMFEVGIEPEVAQLAPLPWSGYTPDGVLAMLLGQAGPTEDRFEQVERIGA